MNQDRSVWYHVRCPHSDRGPLHRAGLDPQLASESQARRSSAPRLLELVNF